MIFRLTEKLAAKLKIKLTKSLPKAANPIADWSAALFTARGFQFLLITNTTSLYSTLLPARGITNDRQFLTKAADAVSDYMVADGLQHIHTQFLAALRMEPVTWSKSLNRSVTGSMNDFIFQARFHIAERGTPPFAVSDNLNMCPMGAMDYANPREAILSLAAHAKK